VSALLIFNHTCARLRAKAAPITPTYSLHDAQNFLPLCRRRPDLRDRGDLADADVSGSGGRAKEPRPVHRRESASSHEHTLTENLPLTERSNHQQRVRTLRLSVFGVDFAQLARLVLSIVLVIAIAAFILRWFFDKASEETRRPPEVQYSELPASHVATRDYTVGRNDTYYSIAKHELGDASRWKELPIVSGVPAEDLRMGLVIKIPITSEVPAKRTYTVKANDTFASIAYDQLGTSKRWKEITTLNHMEPDQLRIGQVLRLPDK
jgi:nucleoid-associated protein YgaU